MARLTLLLSVLTALVALLGGFRYVVDTLREYRWRKRQTGKWLLLCGLLLLPVPAYAVFDASDYRQNTYGAPDHYCDLTLSIAAPSGTGTLGDPWNATRCMSEPVAGDVIGVLPTGGGTPVTLPSPSDWRVPAFTPASCGTAGNPIVFVTKYAAVALGATASAVASNANRTEIRRAGIGDAADVVQPSGANQAGAAYGSNNCDYLTFDGFFVDMQYVQMRNDAGILMAWQSDYTTFKNFVIKGVLNNDCDSNCLILRAEDTIGLVYSNCLVQDFTNVPTGAGLNQRGFAAAWYGTRDFLLEQCSFLNTDNGPMPKGTAPSNVNYNWGTMRYLIIRDARECFRFNDQDATNTTEIHHVLCDNFSQVGIGITSETSAPRNLYFHHNTIADTTGADANCQGALYLKDHGSSSNVIVRDNIFDHQAGGSCQALFSGAEATSFPSFPIDPLDYNGYYHGGDPVRWQYDTTDTTTLATWRTDTGQEANSQVLGSDPFVNRAANDFHVSVGHAARTASSTGGEIGAYEGGHTIGVDTDTSGGTSSSVVMFIEYLGMLLAGLSHVCTAGYLVMRKRTVFLSILIFPYVVGRWVYLKCRFMQYLYAVGRWQRQAPRMLASPTMVAPIPVSKRVSV